jgi:general secretion pathway protein E
MQVQTNIDLSFAEGLRSLMRQDPDIIMVGEIRDLETAQMAIQAALTGHLVLSTLHTNDAPSAVTRLLDIGVPSYLINATVLGIMAQRLVRTLCPTCKTPSPQRHEKLWDELVFPFTSDRPQRVYRPAGCLECRNTGYSGRMGIYEVLMLSSEVKKFITAETDIAKVREQAYKEGMKPLRVSGALKIASGLTTFDEVMRVAPPAGADS